MSTTDETIQAHAAILWAQGKRNEAIEVFAALQSRQPDNLNGAMRLGMAMIEVGRMRDAIDALEPVAERVETTHPVHDWLGRALSYVHWEGRGPDAIVPLQAMLAADPANGKRHDVLARALLSCGRLDEAWPHYAWRWEQLTGAHRVQRDPLVRPDPAAWRGRRVLLFCEQGLGDALQFLRYVPMVIAEGADVTLEVYPELRRLAQTIPGQKRVIAVGEEVPPHDFAVSLMHLPWAFGTSLATIPAEIPYFQADLAAVTAWRARLNTLPGRKVGLVWSGSPRPQSLLAYRVDRRRSFPLPALAPLARIPGVSFVSLQKGEGATQASRPPAGMVLHDWTAELTDFADTAALMQALDLVISADTSPLHLAGALGRPIWLMDRFDSCWRWLRGRDDSPWYPTLRRFRQTAPGDWAGVMARTATALAEWAR